MKNEVKKRLRDIADSCATDLKFLATDPANAPTRAEFKLGIFPPDHHVTPAPQTPRNIQW
jgi:hypothetical protein